MNLNEEYLQILKESESAEKAEYEKLIKERDSFLKRISKDFDEKTLKELQRDDTL